MTVLTVWHRWQMIYVSLQLSLVRGMQQAKPVVSRRQMHHASAIIPIFLLIKFPVSLPQVWQRDPESLLLFPPVMMMVWGAEGGGGGGGGGQYVGGGGQYTGGGGGGQQAGGGGGGQYCGAGATITGTGVTGTMGTTVGDIGAYMLIKINGMVLILFTYRAFHIQLDQKMQKKGQIYKEFFIKKDKNSRFQSQIIESFISGNIWRLLTM